MSIQDLWFSTTHVSSDRQLAHYEIRYWTCRCRPRESLKSAMQPTTVFGQNSFIESTETILRSAAHFLLFKSKYVKPIPSQQKLS